MAKTKTSKTDVFLHPQGSLYGFTPQTDPAREWFQAFVMSEPWQWMGTTLWVDQRFAGDLIEGLINDGFRVN